MAVFAGKTVLITGGGAGLGRAHALRFATAGAHVIIADIDVTGMDETAKLVGSSGGTVESYLCDIGSEEDIAALAANVLQAHDTLDVLINNAGLHAGEIARGFLGLGMAKWQHFYAVNVFGPLLLTEALRPALKAAKGLVINTSSMAAYQPQSAYGITKASLNIFTHAMASHFANDEIRCVAIAPGLMETPNAKAGVDAANWDRLKAMQQVRRQGMAEDIANLALFLASPEGGFINNEVIHCDGGNQMRGFRL
jgi:NAD(P)-dependent dehydrogenase (short-subunit alcohol dehydrogenase family)